MKDTMSQADITRHKNMIISFVNTAIVQTEGVARELNVVKSKIGVATMNTKNIHVYFMDNAVTIDAFINVLYGCTVPDVVCKLQEKIINYVQDSTPFKVKNVNINVSNVIFD